MFKLQVERRPLGSGDPANNELRAEWADEALRAFAYLTHQDTSGDLEFDKSTVVGDLLADRMHLCDRDDINFEACLTTAQMHYDEEVAEEDDDE